MRGRVLRLCLGAWLVFAAPASGASKNVELLSNLAEAKNATAINFLHYTNAGVATAAPAAETRSM